jgi:hypothetical protein
VRRLTKRSLFVCLLAAVEEGRHVGVLRFGERLGWLRLIRPLVSSVVVGGDVLVTFMGSDWVGCGF